MFGGVTQLTATGKLACCIPFGNTNALTHLSCHHTFVTHIPSQARTIDLCNNPKTKEPKLQAARRIIKEWPALDDEQANFTASVDAQYKAQEQEFAAGAAEESETAGSQAAAAGAGASSEAGGSDHTEL